MTGYEKVMNMSLEELAELGICPHCFGLEDSELCLENSKASCVECLKKALMKEVD